TLSAQGELAADYFALRGIDAQKAMLDETIAAYERSLTITKNKYAVGTASSADVDTAQSNLSTALASRRDLDRQRTAYEDAIAVLLGENPSAFRLAAAPWAPGLPEVPSVLPADVLQRRPDIASAERAVAAANANIGIQRAAFFPSLTLAPYAETSAGSMNQLFAASTSLWSLGASSALTLLDFGARSAQVKQARAAYDKAVAAYRLAALQAFQQVEDDLSALSAYRAEQAHYATAAAAANRAEAVARNEYAAGTVDYTTVTTAQATAYTARVSLINNTVNQQTAAVSLIEAIGGHWDTAAR
ncbi:MAG TPA: efflux transporter outer membrane subunit, partial [Novosphingobium sp.]|nr:efflux transporter outer membrane subunit [Novosphingobium sp.]